MRTRSLAALTLAALLAGCSPRPRAPALMQGEAVYVNAQEGFRFLPPPNWTMSHRAEVPPGPLSEERALVAYRRPVGDATASLGVSMLDIPESADLADVIKQRRGTTEWQPEGEVESLQLGGRPAARGAYRSRKAAGAPALVKEVVAVRKGGRVYFFTAVFDADDAKTREQVRKSIETLSW
ncbi:MAG TPA: hypothetical protein VFA26_07275 [Gemmataceae bacterium]|nr:hypothetical protein [Gemmataceae bacterium]